MVEAAIPAGERASRLRVGLAAADLIVSAAFLLAWSGGWIPAPADDPERPFLIFVNANMLLVGGAALAAAAWTFAASRRGTAGLLLAAVGLLVVGELLCAALEFVPNPPPWGEGLADGIWLVSRLAVAAWFVAAAAGRAPAGPRAARIAAPVVVLLLTPAVWFTVMSPLTAAGEGLAAAMVALDLLALLALAAVVGRLVARPLRRAWIGAAGGLGLYLLTDLVQYRFVAVDDTGFTLGELGYFAGYLAVAVWVWPGRAPVGGPR